MKKLILASASVRRRDILYNTGYSFDVYVSGADESPITAKGLPPHELVMALSRLKGESVLSMVDEKAVVLAADTIVYLDGIVYGKPAGKDEARAMLRALSGNVHQVYTGAFIAEKAGREECFYSMAKVRMAKMSEHEIESYVENCRPFDKAGSYGIQGPGGLFVEAIEGDFFTIGGLPIAEVYKRLKQFEIFPVFKDIEYI